MTFREGTTLPEYPTFFRRSHLAILALLGVAYVVVAWFLPVVELAVPLGLITLLIAPGYALGALALGFRPRWPWALTFVMVVGLSVAVSVLEGLVLLALGKGLLPQVFSLVSLALLALALIGRLSTAPSAEAPRFGAFLRREFALPGHSSGQRTAGYALLAAIVAVLIVIVYLASVFPHPYTSVSLGITGPGGTSATLPTTGKVGEILAINATIGNNATAQTLDLVVRSSVVGAPPANYSSVPWALPLSLGPNQTSTEAIPLSAGQLDTVSVSFDFAVRGSYVVEFLLANSGGAVLATVSIPVTIS